VIKSVQVIRCDFTNKEVDAVKQVELSIGGEVVRVPNPVDVTGLDEIGPEAEARLIAFYQNGCRMPRKSPEKKAAKKKKPIEGEQGK